MRYYFQDRFTGDILRGAKTSTIRRPGKRRHVRAGGLVQCYVGQGDNARRLVEAPCLWAKLIDIYRDCIAVEGERQCNPAFYETLARVEGFGSIGNLQAWFDRRYGLPVRGFTWIAWDFPALTERSDPAALALLEGFPHGG